MSAAACETLTCEVRLGSGWEMASAHVSSGVKLAEFYVATGHRRRLENLLNYAGGARHDLCDAVSRCVPRKSGYKSMRVNSTAQLQGK